VSNVAFAWNDDHDFSTPGRVGSNMDRAQLIARHPGYRWVINRGLVGRTAFTALQPWYFLPEEERYYATEKWPSGPNQAPLLVFARRQDCDDLACFEAGGSGASEAVLIEGWSAGRDSYDIVESYPTFWEWMKSVVGDIADWSALPGEE
jgi:hypothetical protein